MFLKILHHDGFLAKNGDEITEDYDNVKSFKFDSETNDIDIILEDGTHYGAIYDHRIIIEMSC